MASLYLSQRAGVGGFPVQESLPLLHPRLVFYSSVILFSRDPMSTYSVPGPVLGEWETTDWWEMDRHLEKA